MNFAEWKADILRREPQYKPPEPVPFEIDRHITVADRQLLTMMRVRMP